MSKIFHLRINRFASPVIARDRSGKSHISCQASGRGQSSDGCKRRNLGGQPIADAVFEYQLYQNRRDYQKSLAGQSF
ncbi:MAG: hypothetical protein RLZZ139_4240 [Cyanobacteriota bacterium]